MEIFNTINEVYYTVIISHMKITYKNIKYNSWYEFCEINKIDYDLFQIRRHRGWTIEEAMYGKYRYIYEGTKYKSALELSRKLNINKHSIPNLLAGKSGDVTEIVNKFLIKYHKNKEKNKQIEFKGKKYNSLQEICDDYGCDSWYEYCQLNEIDYDLFQIRRHRGWSVEESIHGRYKYIYEQTNYKSSAELSKKLNVSAKCMSNLLAGKSGDVTDVVNEYLKKQKEKEIEFKGKRYKSLKALCDDYGVKYDTFSKRRAKGLSLQEALTTRKRKRY